MHFWMGKHWSQLKQNSLVTVYLYPKTCLYPTLTSPSLLTFQMQTRQLLERQFQSPSPHIVPSTPISSSPLPAQLFLVQPELPANHALPVQTVTLPRVYLECFEFEIWESTLREMCISWCTLLLCDLCLPSSGSKSNGYRHLVSCVLGSRKTGSESLQPHLSAANLGEAT